MCNQTTTCDQGWRQHFSTPAADLLQIYHYFSGLDLQTLLMECFKDQARRRSRSQKISEPTVARVLQLVNDRAKADQEVSQ